MRIRGNMCKLIANATPEKKPEGNSIFQHLLARRAVSDLQVHELFLRWRHGEHGGKRDKLFVDFSWVYRATSDCNICGSCKP